MPAVRYSATTRERVKYRSPRTHQGRFYNPPPTPTTAGSTTRSIRPLLLRAAACRWRCAGRRQRLDRSRRPCRSPVAWASGGKKKKKTNLINEIRTRLAPLVTTSFTAAACSQCMVDRVSRQIFFLRSSADRRVPLVCR